MKKLYAIRNKKTGEYYMEPDRIIPDKDEVFAATTKEWAVFIRRLEDMKDTHEIISFCIEPTEPCEYCRGNAKELVDGDTTIFINHEDKVFYADWGGSDYLAWEYCPMCGRRLT